MDNLSMYIYTRICTYVRAYVHICAFVSCSCSRKVLIHAAKNRSQLSSFIHNCAESVIAATNRQKFDLSQHQRQIDYHELNFYVSKSGFK